MKKMWTCTLTVLVLAALCACSSQGGVVKENPAPAATEAPTVTEAPVTTAAPATAAPVAAAPAETDPPAPEPEADTLSAVQDLIGEDVALLYAAIGEPNSSDYAPSCLVDGEDGELYYDEFVVYTQRTTSGETVYYVE